MTLRCQLVLVLAAVAGPALAQGISLPPGFDGRYAPMGESCDGVYAITVAGGVITVMDGAMVVMDLVEQPGRADQVVVTLDVSIADYQATETAVLTLVERGQELHIDYPDGTSERWRRCN
jgi:hypothetical protein